MERTNFQFFNAFSCIYFLVNKEIRPLMSLLYSLHLSLKILSYNGWCIITIRWELQCNKINFKKIEDMFMFFVILLRFLILCTNLIGGQKNWNYIIIGKIFFKDIIFERQSYELLMKIEKAYKSLSTLISNIPSRGKKNCSCEFASLLYGGPYILSKHNLTRNCTLSSAHYKDLPVITSWRSAKH